MSVLVPQTSFGGKTRDGGVLGECQLFTWIISCHLANMERESQYLLRNIQNCWEIHNFLVNSQVFEDLPSLTLMIS